MHYRKYSSADIVDAMIAIELLRRIFHRPMSLDIEKWDVLGELEAEYAAMQLELTRRANPPERIVIQVEVEAA
jgi:hypothetical protein